MSEFMRGLQAFERLVKSDEGVRTGSCGKCGGSGHLTYECRNMIKLDTPTAKPKSSSRFGFLKKQLPSNASSPTGSVSSPSALATGSDKQPSSDLKNKRRSSRRDKSGSRSPDHRRGRSRTRSHSPPPMRTPAAPVHNRRKAWGESPSPTRSKSPEDAK
ncbi:hypothetical protein FBU30_002840 [Linnemannia zychae]|nr:hypothetical protein FBU30_002840 [Linnemannia zychae]